MLKDNLRYTSEIRQLSLKRVADFDDSIEWHATQRDGKVDMQLGSNNLKTLRDWYIDNDYPLSKDGDISFIYDNKQEDFISLEMVMNLGIESFDDYQDLIEGITQEDDSFREAIQELDDFQFNNSQVFGELRRTQNRLDYAMLGVHPIYRREVELAGLVDFTKDSLELMDGSETLFKDLDPAYVSFLRSQQRIYNCDEVMPLSSVALRASNELLKDDMDVPDISQLHMNLPTNLNESSTSRKVLEKAFTNSMVLMTHLHRELEKSGLLQAYGMNKDQLIQYVGSNSFKAEFEHSLGELGDVAALSIKNYGV